LRRRQRRATANLLVRGVGPGGGSRAVGFGSPGSTGERLADAFLQREGNFYRPRTVILTTQPLAPCLACRARHRCCPPFVACQALRVRKRLSRATPLGGHRVLCGSGSVTPSAQRIATPVNCLDASVGAGAPPRHGSPLPTGRGIGRGFGRGVVKFVSAGGAIVCGKSSPGFCQTHARDRGW
jgi:hypothetical protein